MPRNCTVEELSKVQNRVPGVTKGRLDMLCAHRRVQSAGGATAEEDIGKVVARAVNDPRTANKRLVIKGSDFTQNQIIAAWETVSGKTVARQDVSAEDLIQIINGALTHVPGKRGRRTSYSQ